MKILKDLREFISGTKNKVCEIESAIDRKMEDFNCFLTGQQPRCDIVTMFIFDASGSMFGKMGNDSRFNATMRSGIRFCELWGTANPNGVIFVILFAERPKVCCGPVNPKKAAQCLKELEQTVPDLGKGETAMGLSLREGHQLVRRYPASVKRRFVVLTDGHNNSGPDPVPIAQQIKQEGVELNVIGFAEYPSDVNEYELRQVASPNRYWYCDNVPDLVERFERLAVCEINN